MQHLTLSIGEHRDRLAPHQHLEESDDRMRNHRSSTGDLDEVLLCRGGRQRLRHDPVCARRDAGRQDESALLLAVDADPVPAIGQRADRGDALPHVGLCGVGEVQIEDDQISWEASPHELFHRGNGRHDLDLGHQYRDRLPDDRGVVDHGDGWPHDATRARLAGGRGTACAAYVIVTVVPSPT
ncbi:hypothetical protein [Micromonospora sp. NPDC051296]|uniref:hypothetical protein n=1 Tax=Micromonospora sp. NPDC051296 TaxID=3155046 RepID=UPI00343B77E2